MIPFLVAKHSQPDNKKGFGDKARDTEKTLLREESGCRWPERCVHRNRSNVERAHWEGHWDLPE